MTFSIKFFETKRICLKYGSMHLSVIVAFCPHPKYFLKGISLTIGRERLIPIRSYHNSNHSITKRHIK